MGMEKLSLFKLSAAPTAPYAPNALYFVRVGAGFSLYVTDKDGVVAYSLNSGSSAITSSQVVDALGFTPIDIDAVGAANGVAALDAGGKVPGGLLPISVVQGTKNIQVINANTAAAPSQTYVLTASLTLTLPAEPQPGDWVAFANFSSTPTPVVARNGKNIMGLSEDMTLDKNYHFGTLVYADADRGWIFQ